MAQALFVILILLGLCIPLALLFGAGWVLEKLLFGPAEAAQAMKTVLVPGEVENTLLRKFSYYRRLSFPEKQRFARRVNTFMSRKEFHGREGLEVTNEMKILISAAAVQVTFGLKHYLFDHFSQIYIYPRAYYNRFTKKKHAGEVNLAGIIVFSWEDFREGFSVEHSNYNVGLHEMAHALRFDKMKSDEYDHFFAAYFDKWIGTAYDEFLKIKRGGTSFIREYGGTNINEFFAVCVEYFFESPHEFRERLPEIYKQLCILLNQDPLGRFDSEHPLRSFFLGRHEGASPSGNVIVSSGYNSRIFLILLLPAFVLFLSYLDPGKKNGEAATPAFVVAGIFLVLAMMKFRRVILYEDAMVEERLFISGKKVVWLENVTSAAFEEADMSHLDFRTKSLVWLFAYDGVEMNFIEGETIGRKSFSLEQFSTDEVRRIINYLRSKKILVKIHGSKWLG